MKRIKGELLIFWKFVSNDILATIVPGMLFCIVSISLTNPDTKLILESLLASFLYFAFYAYSFTLVNQSKFIEEDKVNKPYRILANSTFSNNSLKFRTIVVTIIFLSLGILFGVTKWALLWVLISFFHNVFGHKHWITKNLISMTLGIFVMFGAGWEIVSPVTKSVLIWGIIISITNGFCGVIQDFRDVRGDKLVGRETLPIQMGENVARFLSIIFCILSFTLYSIYFFLDGYNQVQALFLLLILILYVIISIRLVLFRSVKDDHNTYTVLLILFNLMILSGSAFLR